MPKTRTSFRKGQSGNPGGRPKGIATLREALQKHEARTFQRLGDALEDPDPKVYLEAVKHIHAYLYGKPAQAVQLTGEDGGPIRSETKVKGERPDTVNSLAKVLGALEAAGKLHDARPAAEAGPSPHPADVVVLGAQPPRDTEGLPPS